MSKVAVSLNVDDEVKAVVDTVKGAVADIVAKAAIVQDFTDAAANLAKGIADISNLSADLKSNPDNMAYIGAGLGQIGYSLLNPAPAAPAVPAS